MISVIIRSQQLSVGSAVKYRAPLLCENAIPVHEGSSNCQHGQSKTERRPQELYAESPILAEMKVRKPRNNLCPHGCALAARPTTQELTALRVKEHMGRTTEISS